MFTGIVSIVVFASIVNLALGQYKFGFEGQPIAHNDVLWNFLSMTLAGLCFSLGEGCPGKHLVQMGTGNLSSVIFVIGMAAGAAVAHNFLLGGGSVGGGDGVCFCGLCGIFSQKSRLISYNFASTSSRNR